MGEFSPWHLLILAGVFVLLFGAKRLPDGARALGRSLRIFKTEVKGLGDGDKADEDKADEDKNQTESAPAALTAAPVAPPATEPVDTASAAQQHEAR
jgi:sec-independent protein translocase protein TatA